MGSAILMRLSARYTVGYATHSLNWNGMESTLGNLRDLVGEIEDLDPPLHVGTSTALVTLRFGKPEHVFLPGTLLRKSGRPGKGIPRRSPQGIRVSTKEQTADLELEDVLLNDVHALTKIRIPFVIKFNRADEFAGLLRYITDRGLNFAERLEDEVANELGPVVRAALRRYDAETLHQQASLRGVLAPHVPQTLLEGLFVIVQLNEPEATWDASFLRIRKAKADVVIAAEETRLQIEAAPLKNELARAEAELDAEAATLADQIRAEAAVRQDAIRAEQSKRDDTLTAAETGRRLELEAEESRLRDAMRLEEATRLGMTLEDYIYREDREAQRERAFDRDQERALKALDVLGNIDYRRMPPEIARALERLGAPTAAPALPPGEPAAMSRGDSDVVESTAVDLDSLGPGSLRSDGALARMWQTAGIPGVPLALGFDDAASPVTVVVVTSDPLDAVVTTSIQQTSPTRDGR